MAARRSRGFAQELSPKPKLTGPLTWKSPIEIVKYPDPCLRAENLTIVNFDEDLAKLASEMFDIMYRTEGVGLAAPQVGVNVRLMVYNPEGFPDRGEEHILVNPTLIKTSGLKDVFEEGCLSFPEILGDVVRPIQIKVEYFDVKGKKKKLRLNGWQARIFQHEFDHLEGVLFHDRMSPEVLASGVGDKLKALEEEYARNNA
eukprot:CAMPEP_0197865048 /NCGR_PEP_ID=MMETSP1438-20131217/43440_1 /TAXON_ID=1461541 /ORGANISM="Pterosperma sp., Strain CCMP1384" /LENGTH=200 /DNA_ID=CAMNT_0043483453 /DNA_START=356 /DNA_END=958 /DNA_ORIENTATION=+